MPALPLMIVVVCALATGTVVLKRMGRARYAWITLLPMAFVTATTTTAGVQMITKGYWPKTASGLMVMMNSAMVLVILGCAYVIFGAAWVAWRRPEKDLAREASEPRSAGRR